MSTVESYQSEFISVSFVYVRGLGIEVDSKGCTLCT